VSLGGFTLAICLKNQSPHLTPSAGFQVSQTAPKAYERAYLEIFVIILNITYVSNV
jgi:hypothetical protein